TGTNSEIGTWISSLTSSTVTPSSARRARRVCLRDGICDRLKFDRRTCGIVGWVEHFEHAALSVGRELHPGACPRDLGGVDAARPGQVKLTYARVTQHPL